MSIHLAWPATRVVLLPSGNKSSEEGAQPRVQIPPHVQALLKLPAPWEAPRGPPEEGQAGDLQPG